MARVILLAPFADRFPDRGGELALAAANLFALVRALDGLAPGLGEDIELHAAIAVNGMVIADWSHALGESDEVMFVPKVAGG